MENGKLYLIIFKQEENMSLVKLAYSSAFKNVLKISD